MIHGVPSESAGAPMAQAQVKLGIHDHFSALEASGSGGRSHSNCEGDDGVMRGGQSADGENPLPGQGCRARDFDWDPMILRAEHIPIPYFRRDVVRCERQQGMVP